MLGFSRSQNLLQKLQKLQNPSEKDFCNACCSDANFPSASGDDGRIDLERGGRRPSSGSTSHG